MQINRIGSNINFQKVIKVKVDGESYKNAAKYQQDCCDNFCQILNNETPVLTGSQERQEIKDFMRINYDGKNTHVASYMIDSDFYIFTGKDAYQAGKIYEEARHDIKMTDLDYKMLLPEDMPYDMQLQLQNTGANQAEKDRIMFIRDSKLAEFAQNGGLTKTKMSVNLETELAEYRGYRNISAIDYEEEAPSGMKHKIQYINNYKF